MASLKDISRRISAVKNTQKVTRAMKLVAAAKLKRAQTTTFAARKYASELHNITTRISRHLGERAPLMWQRPKEIKCIDLIVISSDRGLCGGFNENLFGQLEDEILTASNHGIAIKLFVIGKKGTKHFSAKKYDVEIPPSTLQESETITWVVDKVVDRYIKGQSAGCNIVFNKFVTTSRQEPTFWNMLPLHKRGNEKERNLEYLYEPTRESVLDFLCRESLLATVRQSFSESRAAELAARMVAMDNATKNAEDMVSHLTFVYNRARQESITSDLMDIVGGAEALK